MDAAEFDHYTERLRISVESARDVIGLVTLGSTCDASFRDVWSDHDFWVITKPGAQEAFVEDLSWLPDHENIAITVRHLPHGRTVVFHNRHKVEFAVFDVEEARSGQVQRYQVLIDRDQIADLIETIQEMSVKQTQIKPDALENLCVAVWSACERYGRGELLSARQYLDGFAVNKALRLIGEPADGLDPRRRVELSSPELAAEFLGLLHQPVPQAAVHLLEIVQRELKPKQPTLAWDKVSLVHGWISELLDRKVE